MQRVSIKDIRQGEIGIKIQSVFFLKEKYIKRAKNNTEYLSMIFSDITGIIGARLWQADRAALENIQPGSFISVLATVDEYRGDRQLIVNDISLVSEKDINFSDFVKSVDNIDRIWQDVTGYLREIKDPFIKTLADEFLKDQQFVERFKKAPGAKLWHNAYIGGLLEHTYEVMKIGQTVCELYPQINKDIVMIGMFLHDMGKVWELDPKNFDYTLEGNLIGHISIGHRVFLEKASKIINFPKDLLYQLEHVILSHHGEYEQQSPVLPKTLEATVVYHSDELMSQINAVSRLINENRDMGRSWSDFISIKNRRYYTPADMKDE